MNQLPSEAKKPYNWRTHTAPFESVWDEVQQQLEQSPGLQVKTVFQSLQRLYPGQFQDGQLRTLQRHIKQWPPEQSAPLTIPFLPHTNTGNRFVKSFDHFTCKQLLPEFYWSTNGCCNKQLGGYFMTSTTSQINNASIGNNASKSNWRKLIQQAKGGCDLALVEIIKQFETYLLMVAKTGMRSSLQRKFGASDILQISLLEAHKSIEQFNGTSESEIRNWLKRIVLNNLLDQSKQYTATHKRSLDHENPLGELDIPSGLDTPSVMIRREESDVELMRLVDALPEQQRFVVEARHRFGLSYSEIAVQLDTTEANARQLWSRAAKQLRNKLDNSLTAI